jgi:hypothetical protein
MRESISKSLEIIIQVPAFTGPGIIMEKNHGWKEDRPVLGV